VPQHSLGCIGPHQDPLGFIRTLWFFQILLGDSFKFFLEILSNSSLIFRYSLIFFEIPYYSLRLFGTDISFSSIRFIFPKSALLDQIFGTGGIRQILQSFFVIAPGLFMASLCVCADCSGSSQSVGRPVFGVQLLRRTGLRRHGKSKQFLLPNSFRFSLYRPKPLHAIHPQPTHLLLGQQDRWLQFIENQSHSFHPEIESILFPFR